MNQLILENLALLKWLSIANLVIFGYMAILLTGVVIGIRKGMKGSDEHSTQVVEERAIFYSIAADLFESGKFSECKSHVQNRIDDFPNDPSPHWYLALCSMKEENWSAALSSFAMVKEIDPMFRDYEISRYEEQIGELLSGPKNCS